MSARRGEVLEDIAHIALPEGHDLPFRWANMHCTACHLAMWTSLDRGFTLLKLLKHSRSTVDGCSMMLSCCRKLVEPGDRKQDRAAQAKAAQHEVNLARWTPYGSIGLRN